MKKKMKGKMTITKNAVILFKREKDNVFYIDYFGIIVGSLSTSSGKDDEREKKTYSACI